ncbi:uncharacterized protein [Haliotis cracherodii]|uniref:uncharacterized protein n=1 Tax=Haliotis cracherodii TaxID=6455 RepID=UPI0039EA185F
MDGFPTAFYLAGLEDVINNPYVLFRLVTPTPPNRFQKRGGVESAAGLVNVIPQRRVYRMETVEEIEIFKRELIKRPLVLQCMSHSGMGCGSTSFGCGILPNDRNWVLLINQTYPKILSRIQMGCDAAKNAMNKGHPFVLRFRFGTLLQRLHSEIFPEEEMRTPALHYAEWEFAEVVIRFPGGHLSSDTETPPTTVMAPVCTELNFDFADITLNEIKRVQNPQDKILRGKIPAITEDEIRDVLHGWTINEISPLDDIGEERPETYNYAQAGRLYESFRRKKRRQPKASDSSEAAGEKPDDKIRMHSVTSAKGDSVDIREVETSFVEDEGGFSSARRNVHSDTRQPVRPQRRGDNYQPRVQEKREQGYGNGHLYPDITVVDNNRGRTSSSDSYYNISPGPGVAKPFDQIPHRDSDRSSHSTGGADSGYSGADDDGFSGYYGNRRQDGHRRPNEHMRESGGRHYDPMDKYGNTPTQRAHENHGFRHDDNDDIIRKHKELASKMKPSGRYDYGGNGQSRDVYDRPNKQYDDRHDNARFGRSQNHYNNDRSDTRRDYYEQRDRSRGYSSEQPPPSYNNVAAPEEGPAFRLHEKEAMAESFI